jgi:hypothetical protein
MIKLPKRLQLNKEVLRRLGNDLLEGVHGAALGDGDVDGIKKDPTPYPPPFPQVPGSLDQLGVCGGSVAQTGCRAQACPGWTGGTGNI